MLTSCYGVTVTLLYEIPVCYRGEKLCWLRSLLDVCLAGFGVSFLLLCMVCNTQRWRTVRLDVLSCFELAGTLSKTQRATWARVCVKRRFVLRDWVSTMCRPRMVAILRNAAPAFLLFWIPVPMYVTLFVADVGQTYRQPNTAVWTLCYGSSLRGGWFWQTVLYCAVLL